jgi:hypothetical protein
MKKVMIMAAVAALLTACGGANDGDATSDTTSMPAEPMTIDSNSNAGSMPFDSTRDTSSGFSSSPTDPASRTSTPGGSTNQNDSTRQ